MRVLFVEPPKDFWFVMGEYLPPPLGLLQLASFLEKMDKETEIEVVDCQAEGLDWRAFEKRIESFDPDIVASSGFGTCNAYTTVRALATAKKVKPEALTVTGGQHFTATAQETLETYPEVDVIVRGEGEQTLVQLVRAHRERKPFSQVQGISFRHDGEVIHNASRSLIQNMDELPLPGYHFIENLIHRYHFKMMAGSKTRYALIEGSRGCPHRCSFCSQWKHWQGTWRTRSAKRIADEMEFCYTNYGTRFLWLTDDNFLLGKTANDLCEEIMRRGLADDVMWFLQARCDNIVEHEGLLSKMRRAGVRWILLGIESNSGLTLERYNKDLSPESARRAIRLLKQNDIFAQGTFIIGERRDTAQSIESLREFANDLDPDLVIFMVLTPFPGTDIYQAAKSNGWIEDKNWANYDMIHAIMPTETLSREEVQGELYRCYRSFYGSLNRRLTGIFSQNELKRKTFRYLASQSLLKQMRDLF